MLPHEKPGLQGGLYCPLTDSAMKDMAEASYEILEKSGMAVYSPTAFEAFKAAGCEVDTETSIVKIPRSLIEDAVDSAPSSVTLHARKDDYNAVLEESKVHYGTGGTAIYVLDPKTGERRTSDLLDVVLNARLVEELENIHVFTINVFPNDIEDTNEIDTNRFFHALNNTGKHVMGGIYSMEGCKKVVEMAQMMAGSPEKLAAEPFVSFITLLISPYKIDHHYGEMTCYLAEQGLPVVVPTEPMCGTTSPITLASNVLVHVSETLAGIAMIQLINKGAPGICGSVGSISDIATMNNLGGPVERGMLNAAVAQMAQYFKIPFYGTAGTSDALSTDVQAAYETAMSALLVAMSGANYIHDIAGLMESDLTVGYDKLVVDNEILGMCQRVLRGIECNEETLAKDLIIEKGPAKDFLGETHTIMHMRDEFFVPKLANRIKRDTGMATETAMDRANKTVKRILSAEHKPLIDEAVQKQIMGKFGEIRGIDEKQVLAAIQ